MSDFYEPTPKPNFFEKIIILLTMILATVLVPLIDRRK